MQRNPRGGQSGFYVTVDGVDESLSILTKAGANVRGLSTGAVFNANSELRAGAGRLADWLARTTIRPIVATGPAPQAFKMADTIRRKVDRKVIVRVGATNPKLSGWRRSGRSPSYRGSIAWGIERGAYPGSPDRYKVPRTSASGGVIGRQMPLIQQRTIPRYRELVRIALETAGVTSFGRAA